MQIEWNKPKTDDNRTTPEHYEYEVNVKVRGNLKECNWFIEKLNTLDSEWHAGEQRISELYDELILSVEKKYPNETRHETALRYIKECENRNDSQNSMVG